MDTLKALLLERSVFDIERGSLLVLIVALAGLGFVLSRGRARKGTRTMLWPALTRHRYVTVLAAAAASLAIGYAIAGLPSPWVMDEFSYLLAADTFASGRLANPAHPMASFFEAPYVLQRPHYGSMYQPGQGLLLALGQVLGHPWIGVALSILALGLVILWALEAWMPARWALAGALLSIPLFNFGYWAQSYWGGSLAACGGAMVLGALGRFRRRPTAKWAAVAALGGVVLLTVRPAEGAVLSLVVGVYLVRGAVRVRRWRLLAPAGLIAAGAIAGQLYYDWRVTGDPLLPPYVLGLRNQVSRRMFVWQSPRPAPAAPHPFLAEVARMHYRAELTGLARFRAQYQPVADLFGGLLWLLPLAALPWIRRDRRLWPLHAATASVLALNLLTEWVHPHYTAPVAAGLLAVLITGLRHLRTRTLGRELVPVILAAVVIFTGAARAAQLAPFQAPETYGVRRAQLEAQLTARPQAQLVIVRYHPGHWVHEEWVYNRAAIDAAKIVWTRDYGDERNGDVVRYFAAREAWLWEPDLKKLTPLARAN